MVGGLVGYNDNQVVNSFAFNDVEGGYVVGGLVGINNAGKTIINSYAVNTVSGVASVGGLVGLNENDAKIINSYADGGISGGDNTGGLVGANSGTINNAYASGSVLGGRAVGGLVGTNKGAVADSYAVVAVAGHIRVGGLSGVGDNGLVARSYWDIDLSAIQHSSGGDGFGTSALQAPTAASAISSLPYYRWSSEDWYFGNTEQYPTLKYASGDNSVRTACSIASELPDCSDLLLPYGLMNIETLEASRLSPSFKFSHFDYRLDVNPNEAHIRLIPTAFATDALITVKVNGIAHAVVDSGGKTSPVVLQAEDETVITIEVADMVYTVTAMPLPAIAKVKDIDDDDDGLIEINYLEDLHAVRYQPRGTAYQARDEAEPVTTGCAVDGCRGYELVRDLDFTHDESYRDPHSNKAVLISQHGWQPIGGFGEEPLNCLFQGNGYSISNLIITSHESDSVGLFGVIADGAEIDGVGLLNFDIRGASLVGGLVGNNDGGKIVNSYLIGRVSATGRAGGLVGKNTGTILNSYASGQISGMQYLGGLVGENQGNIANSYAMNRIAGKIHGGGLVGLNNGVVENSYALGEVRLDESSPVSGLIGMVSGGAVNHSYWDIETSGITTGTHGIGLNSDALKTPTTNGTVVSDVYYGWHHLDWDFGSRKHYPALKYANGNDALLPYQRSGLRRLLASDGAVMFPTFDTHIFDYQLTVTDKTDLITLRAIAVDDDARIVIAARDFTDEQRGSMTMMIPLARRGATDVTLTVKTASHRSVSYKLIVNRSSAMEISGLSRSEVEEGERIILDGSHRLDNGSFEYLWTQTSGSPLLSGAVTNQAVLDFIVPTDLLAKAVDYGEVTLRLEVRSDESLMKKDLSLIINKRNNGFVTKRFDVPVLRNATLIASAESSSDPDGPGNLNAAAYQWQDLSPTAGARWRNIRGATARHYEIPASVLDMTRYRVLISYVDGQGYIHEDIDSEIFTAIDIDKDDDGLIEIRNVQDWNAMYHALDGSGYRRNAGATTSTVGCPETGCRGFELSTDLDLRRESRDPIGSKDEPFTAVFKGHHHKVFNANINNKGGDATGLFAATSSGAEIDGIGLVRATVRGNGNVGSLVGINKGLVSNSYAIDGWVRGSQDGIGGLIGINDGDGDFSALVINSYADTNIDTESADDDDFVIIGGLVAHNINTAKISNSYAMGHLRSPCGAGGLVGYSSGVYSKIENSYATSNVSLTASGTARCREHNLRYAGGLVGENDASVIENSYATGKVSGDEGNSLGGLVGTSRRHTDTRNSYWNVTTSGVKISAGGTSKTTVQLQSPIKAGSTATEIYYGWSSRDWDFGTKAQYPYLRHALVNGKCGALQSLGCNLLLSHQDESTGLAQLILLGDARLVPAFDTRILAYKVVLKDTDIMEFIPIAENPNTKNTISKNDIFMKTVATGERVSIPLNETTTTLITIDSAEPNQRMARYKLRVNHPPEIVISGVPNAGEVSEGMRIVLDASRSYDMNKEDLLSYKWEQLSGPSLSLDPKGKASPTLDFIVPEDLVARSAMSSAVILRLTVGDDAVSVSRDIPLRITKLNNGDISIDAPKLTAAFEMSAAEIEWPEDADGGGNPDGIAYQWQRRIANDWHDVLGERDSTYSLTPNTTVGAVYRLQVTYIDGQGYTNTTFSKTLSYVEDVDRDGDGLIEIATLEELNAMRYVPDGSGYKESLAHPVISAGCPVPGCKGYELIGNLDFKHDASYRNPSLNKKTWSEGRGWLPIGDRLSPFAAVFNGNGYTISNLTIKSAGYDIGFFGFMASTAKVDNIGLSEVDVDGENDSGGLVGNNIGGTISNSYVSGSITGDQIVGGIVGLNDGGSINNSYAHVNVEGDTLVGGLVAYHLGGVINDSYVVGDIVANSFAGGLIGLANNSTLSNSYMVGKVIAENDVGGILGSGIELNPDAITNSYWNMEINQARNSPYGIALSTAQMQQPTAPGTTPTDAYYNWSTDDWDFGNESQYPVLKNAAGKLLPRQSAALLGLSLSHPAESSPRFDPEIFDYDVTVAANATYLRVLATATNADIRGQRFQKWKVVN